MPVQEVSGQLKRIFLDSTAGQAATLGLRFVVYCLCSQTILHSQECDQSDYAWEGIHYLAIRVVKSRKTAQ